MNRNMKIAFASAMSVGVILLIALYSAGCGSVGFCGGGGVGVGAAGGNAARETAREDLPPQDRPLTDQEIDLNRKSFDYVWARIHESLWPEILEEADWDGAYIVYKPRVEEAGTMREFRSVMGEMLDLLGISHMQIIPGELYDRHLAAGPDAGPAEGETGVSVRVIDGRAVVTGVREGSAAWNDGVRPGWIVESLGGRNVAEGLAELADYYEGHFMKDLVLEYVTQAGMKGDAGDEIEAVFLDGEDRSVAVDLVLEPARGATYEFGNLPPVHVWFDTMTVDADIEYFGFNMFMDPVHLVPAFGRAAGRAARGSGMIIDLRGNSGGMGIMACWMAGFLYEEKGHYFGTFKMKGTELKMVVNPRPGAYTGPVAVLVDGLSLSASEFFAGGLQGTGRAEVFGQRTPGFAMPSVVERLPNGDAIQYVNADYVDAGGVRLEGMGVTPDLQVTPARSHLLEGRDPVLQAAVGWIRAQTGGAEN